MRTTENRATFAAAAAMLTAPIVLLGFRYPALPAQLPMLRGPLHGAAFLAPKSLFTVFRVPLMNLTHGLIAATLLARAADFSDPDRRASYSRVFSTLLLAIALKSDCEALELSAFHWPVPQLGAWLALASMASIVAGLALALLSLRGVSLPWPELRLRFADKVVLVLAITAYCAILAATALLGHRG